MRRILTKSLALVLVSLLLRPAGAAPTMAADGSPAGGILHIRVLSDEADREGTCVLVAREDRGDDTVLHLLTAARLFRKSDAFETLSWRAVRIEAADGSVFDAKPLDVVVSGSSLVDVATVRIAAASFVEAPEALTWTMPSPGDAIRIEGFEASGALAAFDARIRFVSTRLASTDRDLSGLRGCLGAPALLPAGVFGVVTDCTPGRGAVIAMFWMDRWFIERALPRATVITRREP